jgi:DNA-binding NarL/FixJ family response regulator
VLVETEEDLVLVGSVEDGQQAADLARREHPDVFLMDIRMPVKDGLTALREIVDDPSCAETRVIMLTTFELDEYVFEALRGGASGFLIKDGEPAELLQAIRVVADGGSLLASSVTRKLIEEFVTRQPNRTTPHPRLGLLTVREREIVGWVATGRSNDEIAAVLVVSPATVRTHVGRSMTKLGARDRAQLVVFAYQSGLAP